MWNNRQTFRQIIWKGYCDLRLRAAFTIILAFTWWGVLYPELCFTKDTFLKITVTEDGESMPEEADYREIMNASGDDIVIRSRLLEWLEEQDWFRHGG